MLRYWSLFSFCFAFLAWSFITHAENKVSEIDEASCFSKSWSKEKLVDLKNDKFSLSNQSLHDLLPQLRYCLASSDPVIRDDVAYAAYSTWLRGGDIKQPALTSLFDTLLNDIAQKRNDAHSVFLPFVVLVFSEVLRVDRKVPYLKTEQRVEAVNTLSSFMVSTDDYRGFDAQLGWRHSVAHASDAMLQLALNPNIHKAQLQKMLNAIAQQIPAKGGHFYIYSEPERLARPVYYTMRRNELAVEFWQQWINQIAGPHPFNSWGEVFKSEQGLAKRHNVKSFLLHLQNFIILGKEDPQLAEINQLVTGALKPLI